MDATVETLGLAALFASAFLSATLLPGNSELALLALLQQKPALLWPALALATAGNTAGGLTSYAVGRLLPRPRENRALRWLERYGPAALLLSWVPFVGDALCVAAGWLRHDLVVATVFIAAGKFARYAALAAGLAWATS